MVNAEHFFSSMAGTFKNGGYGQRFMDGFDAASLVRIIDLVPIPLGGFHIDVMLTRLLRNILTCVSPVSNGMPTSLSSQRSHDVRMISLVGRDIAVGRLGACSTQHTSNIEVRSRERRAELTNLRPTLIVHALASERLG
jgi:hypothetical protein